MLAPIFNQEFSKMFKQILSLSLLLGAVSLKAETRPLPFLIDFGTEFRTHFYEYEFRPELTTTCPFNCALEMSTFFMYAKDVYGIDTVIETGTFKGYTTAFFGSVFDTVHTIEVSPEFYAESKWRWPSIPIFIATLVALLHF